jgi:hypothetical protein
MQTLTTLKFRRVMRSSALEAQAHELSARLRRMDDRIKQCCITLEGPFDAGSVAPSYVVKIELSRPGAQIHADSLHPDGTGHAALDLALRASYENAKRQLQNLRHQRPSQSSL